MRERFEFSEDAKEIIAKLKRGDMLHRSPSGRWYMASRLDFPVDKRVAAELRLCLHRVGISQGTWDFVLRER